MWVKICGITNGDDAAAAVNAGADALGLNFVSGPRKLDPQAAAQIIRAVKSRVSWVALVRLGSEGLAPALAAFLKESGVSQLQLYGSITRDAVSELVQAGFRFMPVVPVKSPEFAAEFAPWVACPELTPAGVVLDAYDPGREGGTGRTFQWDWVVRARAAGGAEWPPLILAGGLHPGNVAEAIRVVSPFGVDVSSGVEVEGSPGKKDHQKLIAFVRNARQAASSH